MGKDYGFNSRIKKGRWGGSLGAVVDGEESIALTHLLTIQRRKVNLIIIAVKYWLI